MSDDARPLDGRWRVLLVRLCEQCVREVGVHSVSLAVATSPKDWSPGAASDPVAAALDEFSITIGEGPALDVLRAHESVVVADLAAASAASRWPVWTPAAVARGMHAVTSTPIEAGAITAGVLTAYADSVWAPSAGQNAALRRFADTALLVLLDLNAALNPPGSKPPAHAPAARASARRGDDLAALLRPEVHQAAGMIVVQAQVPIDQALARLRARAFTEGRSLSELATDVVARRVRFDPDWDLR